MEALLHRAAEWIATARKTVALSGAGVSTESGIPDFRSAGGLWSRYDPAEYATLGAFLRDPEKVWGMLAELDEVLNAAPNAGHLALAELERGGGMDGVITQNVDGLHQAAGSATVVEFHGSGRTLSCLDCGAVYTRQAVRAKGEIPPRCGRAGAEGHCQAILKPDVVFFDEAIPPHAFTETAKLVRGAELILVLGTSCEVYPASEIPQQVRAQGGKIIEINLEPAPGLAADLTLAGKFSEAMTQIVERWKRLRA